MIHLLHTPDKTKTLPTDRPPRLLVIQIAGIGDLVLATPALDALRDQFPKARLDVVTSPRAVSLLEGHPSVDRVYGFDIGRYRNPISLLNPAALASFVKSIRPLQGNRYDALLSMNNISTKRGAWTLGLLMRLIGAPLWVGRDTDGRAPWFDLALPDDSSQPVPEAITKLNVAALLGASNERQPLSLPIKDILEQKALEWLPDSGKPWAALLPGANVDLKMWPVERYAKIANSLAERGYSVVSLGGPGDEPIVTALKKQYHGTLLRFEGKLSLPETAAVLRRCRIAVTNDTGPMHMAAAVGTPLVALFCSHNVARYSPWVEEKRIRVLTSSPTNADDSSPEGMRESILGVTVDRVLGALEDLEQEVMS